MLESLKLKSFRSFYLQDHGIADFKYDRNLFFAYLLTCFVALLVGFL